MRVPENPTTAYRLPAAVPINNNDVMMLRTHKCADINIPIFKRCSEYPAPSASIFRRGRRQSRTVDAGSAHADGGSGSPVNTRGRVESPARPDLCAAHARGSDTLQFHHGRASMGFVETSQPQRAYLSVERRLAGDDIHIDTLFKLVPELAHEGTLRAALLHQHGTAPPSGLSRMDSPRATVVARVIRSRKKLHLLARDRR